MKYYPLKAITFKDINQFDFNVYTAIGVNMIKYNNDSSAIFRLISSFIETSSVLLDGLNYGINFGMQKLSFISIDRISGFTAELNISDSKYIGFSKYSKKEYDLKQVDSYSDFTRSSIPCDGFLSKGIATEDSFSIRLSPNVLYKVKKKIKNTSISIKPVEGFNIDNKVSDIPIKIKIIGKDICGEKIEEIIFIDTYVNYISSRDFSYIESMLALDALQSVCIEVFPYITGDTALRLNPIIDRENFEPSICVVSINKNKKTLNYNALTERQTEYPSSWELIKSIPLELDNEDSIISNFCDVNNKLLYLSVDNNGNKFLHVFPLIIPKTDDATLDFRKTDNQSITIEYLEDCSSEVFNIWIHPTSKTNDIEILNVAINGIDFKSNIILDLISSNMETNKIQVPFSEFIIDGVYQDYIIVTFETVGLESNSSIAIQLDRTKLKKLFSLELIAENILAEEPISTDLIWNEPDLKSIQKEYQRYSSLNVSNADKIFKISNSPNTYIGNYKIVFIYDTFYYNIDTNKIITHDTITHVSSSQFLEE